MPRVSLTTSETTYGQPEQYRKKTLTNRHSRQTETQTNRQTDRETGKNRDRGNDRTIMSKKAETQILPGMQTDRNTDREIGRETINQAD